MEPTETRPTALQVDGGRVAPAAGEMERELFAAIRAKNKERVRELLEMEADVNAYEPVHDLVQCFMLLAFIFPLIPIIFFFTNETDHYKKTPLHVAATTGDPDMVALLLEFGADRNAPAAFFNCCCCKKTPTQFVDMKTGGVHGLNNPNYKMPPNSNVPVEQRAPIKELLMPAREIESV